MTVIKSKDADLLNNAQLAVTDLDQELDTSCLQEQLLFPLKAINSSMLDERLDITLVEYNPLNYHQYPYPVANLSKPFFSIGM